MVKQADYATSSGLSGDKHPPTERELRSVMRMLPLRDRCLLRLLYVRGATAGELAGVLGISRNLLRQTLRRAMARANDPETLATLRCWRRLTDDERRLVYLHRILGTTLATIARLNLICIPAAPGFGGGEPTPGTRLAALRRMVRGIHRKARRGAGLNAPPRETARTATDLRPVYKKASSVVFDL